MVAFNTPITREIPVAFHLPRMAWIARLRFTRLSFCADDRVDLGLGEFGDGVGGRRSSSSSSHVGSGGG